MAKRREVAKLARALDERLDLLRAVRLLARRLLDGAPLRTVARELGWTPGRARLVEGHLVRAVALEGARVRALEAYATAGDR